MSLLSKLKALYQTDEEQAKQDAKRFYRAQALTLEREITKSVHNGDQTLYENCQEWYRKLTGHYYNGMNGVDDGTG